MFGRNSTQPENKNMLNIYTTNSSDKEKKLKDNGPIRFIISHRLRVLYISLDGLKGSGVEDPLSSPAVASAFSAQWLVVQDMDAQQETVVHDLKALQHLNLRDKNE